MINRIILDMDEVLNLLTLDLLEFDGIHMDSYDEYDRDDYDIIAMVAHKTGDPPMSLKEYWDRIPRELWANATLSPEFDEILTFCANKVGLENTLIATSPSKCAECVAGKYEWIEKYIPEEMNRNWSITPRKGWYGLRPDIVLIDDLEINCKKFAEEGGQPIVVPRPWNSWKSWQIMDAIEHQWNTLGVYV